VTLFRLFATRAVAEMRRLRLENELRERQEKLGRLVDSAMDAIVELDSDLRITLMNAAAEKVFGHRAASVGGQGVERLLGGSSTRKLASLAEELEQRPERERYLWIPEGLAAEPRGGKPFPAEATLSRFEMRGRPFYTLILRNVDERLEAERTIRSLAAQAEYLRQEIEADHGFDEIVGASPALRAALQGVAQVAVTDATVLMLGETGTGKELFARAIHRRSARADRPLIKVNCAAIPATLIESEFFGHERGAFTGATERREGRFALADRGTIFLDEVGELPLELQGKLLRVLQEGEFEPVGSSRTRKVDVRVVAATNRDLEREVRAGKFREDLYYRLNVFPLRLPPLRERGDDVVLLATAMAERLARDMGRSVAALSAADVLALKAYAWPGNVRELRNVVERALITSREGRLHLADVLPRAERAEAPAVAVPASPVTPREEILSEARLRQLERDNMVAALERAGGRVGGENGAAALVGISPSTFKSRMKALGIARS
jgi:PAS domain S-box-containing protein